MQINVSTRHGHLSAESQDKISSKADKLSRFHDRISAIVVTVNIKHNDHPHVEVCVAVDGTKGFVAKTDGASLIGRRGWCRAETGTATKAHKEKTIDKHRDPAHKHILPEADAQTEDDVDANIEAE